MMKGMRVGVGVGMAQPETSPETDDISTRSNARAYGSLLATLSPPATWVKAACPHGFGPTVESSYKKAEIFFRAELVPLFLLIK